jgi:hypothetical protein
VFHGNISAVIEMGLVGTGWGGVGWTGLTQDMDTWRALVNAPTNLQVPSTARKFLSSYTAGGLSSNA